MEFKTKFNFGDQVIRIENKRDGKWYTCGFCNGAGRIIGANKETNLCPVCYGNEGRYKYLPTKWIICETLTIGEIRIQHRCECNDTFDSVFDNYGPQTELYEERYMCYETGIGSGTLWPMNQLFYTEEEAQKECDKLNKG